MWAIGTQKIHHVRYRKGDQSSYFICIMFDTYHMSELFKILFLPCCILFHLLCLIWNLDLHGILFYNYGVYKIICFWFTVSLSHYIPFTMLLLSFVSFDILICHSITRSIFSIQSFSISNFLCIIRAIAILPLL